MPEPQADHVHLDAALLTRLCDVAADVGQKLYLDVRRKFARNTDEAAVTLFVLAIGTMLGRALAAFPDPEVVGPQVNALWRILGVPFRITIERVQ